ncbi:hypothetical protein IGI66_000820 [Enterococcus sp. AZ048]|uniref:hypothetical protein n=1 Tax=Enterococcus sp. AZ048 TaxID=2774658 RepID=UPI003F2145C7
MIERIATQIKENWKVYLKKIGIFIVVTLFGFFLNNKWDLIVNKDDRPLYLQLKSFEILEPEPKSIKDGISKYNIPMVVPDKDDFGKLYFSYNGVANIRLKRITGIIDKAYVYYNETETDTDSENIVKKGFHPISFDATPNIFMNDYLFRFNVSFISENNDVIKDFYILTKGKNDEIRVYTLLIKMLSRSSIDTRAGYQFDKSLNELVLPSIMGFYLGSPDELLSLNKVTLSNDLEINIDPEMLIQRAATLKSYYSNL